MPPRERGTEREYLFIDGGSLRSAVRAICKEAFGDESAYLPLVKALVGAFDKVFYYDAVPGKNHGEGQAAYEARVESDHQKFAAIQALDRVHVALGTTVGKDRRQKGVDVRLAVDMMSHAFRGKIGRVTLFAGDADFVPLLRALVAEGLHVTLWHPPQANAELKGAADATRPFSLESNLSVLSCDGVAPAFQFERASLPWGRSQNGVASAKWDQHSLSVQWHEREKGHLDTVVSQDGNLRNAAAIFCRLSYLRVELETLLNAIEVQEPRQVRA